MSLFCALPLIASLFADCAAPQLVLSGYVEGEYVSLAPNTPARILEVTVRRGDRLTPGQIVAKLEDQDARLALNQAEARLSASRADAERARLEIERAQKLFDRAVTAKANLDAAQATADVAQARMKEAEAALASARWSLDQRTVKAQTAGLVDDVLRYAGDMAGPSAPILSVLPEGAVKLRLYVPEPMLPKLAEHQRLDITCDGCPPGLQATISYLAKEPEFTPPVIYSVERRQKLLYLVEARPDAYNPHLRPGVIVDARTAPTP